MPPLLILDRDGVINQDSENYIRTVGEWSPIRGSLEAIARLNHVGFRVVIATNQSGIAKKLFDIETLNRIHQKMQRQLAELGGSVEAIFFCPHQAKDDCDCRKPRPGMLVDIGKRLRTTMIGVPMIGDTSRDIAAARAVGARPILVRTGNGEQTLEAEQDLGELEVFEDLAAAADALIAETLKS